MIGADSTGSPSQTAKKNIEIIEEYKRSAKFTVLSHFDPFAKPDHFMEITEWYNGEGVDVNLNSALGEQRFSLTWGEWDALKALIGPDEDPDDEG